MLIRELFESFDLTKFKPVLKNNYEIASYIESIAGEYVDLEMMEEFFRGQYAVLKILPISEIIEADRDSNVPNDKREKKYRKLNIDNMPPIVIDKNGKVIDGNHRFRVAKYKNVTEIPCYVVKDKENLKENGPNAFSPANCGYDAPSTSPITGITADPYYDEPLNRPDITRTFREYVNNGLSWRQARDRTIEKYGLKSVKINTEGKCVAFEKQGPINNGAKSNSK